MKSVNWMSKQIEHSKWKSNVHPQVPIVKWIAQDVPINLIYYIASHSYFEENLIIEYLLWNNPRSRFIQ